MPLPPVLSASPTCDRWGLNGWCLENARLVLTVSDPQGFPFTISGQAGDIPLACSASCEVPLPEGQGLATVTVTPASGLSVSGEQAWKYDNSAPAASLHLDGVPGINGWYVSVVQVGGIGVDTVSGVRDLQVSVDGEDWQSSASLSDGVRQVQILVRDNAGWETLSGVMLVNVDTAPPDLSMPPSGTLGYGGYYRSAVTVSLAGTDPGSGLALVEYRLDGQAWVPAGQVTIGLEGVHVLEGRVTDVAGNLTRMAMDISIDTIPPVTGFTSPEPGPKAVGKGIIAIEGRVSDTGSGLVQVELSLDNGLIWQMVAIAHGRWRNEWDTRRLPNGEYSIRVRGQDRAGNVEKSPSQTRIIVANQPPFVNLQERWNIWEADSLSVAENGGIPVHSVRITLRDRQQRWPEVIWDYSKRKAPESVRWDRRFGDGTLAPSGEYEVIVEAWDIYGNRAFDKGVIVIPFVAAQTMTVTPMASPLAGSPSPGPTTTLTAAPAQPIPPVQDITVPSLPVTQPAMTPVLDQNEKPLALWPVVGLVGLLMALASASLSDSRPLALARMKDTFAQIMNNQGE